MMQISVSTKIVKIKEYIFKIILAGKLFKLKLIKKIMLFWRMIYIKELMSRLKNIFKSNSCVIYKIPN